VPLYACSRGNLMARATPYSVYLARYQLLCARSSLSYQNTRNQPCASSLVEVAGSWATVDSCQWRLGLGWPAKCAIYIWADKPFRAKAQDRWWPKTQHPSPEQCYGQKRSWPKTQHPSGTLLWLVVVIDANIRMPSVRS